MKKLHLLALGLVVSFLAHGQGEGRWSGALNLNFNQSQTKVKSDVTGKDMKFKIQPCVLYGFAPTWDAGLGLAYNSTTNTSYQNPTGQEKYTLKDKTSLFSIEPFVRRYDPITENLFCFLQASVMVGFGSGTNESLNFNEGGYTIVDSKDKISNLGVGISPGLSWRIAKRYSLDAQYGFLGYSSTTTKPDDPNNDNKQVDSSFGLNLDMKQLNFTFRYTFGGIETPAPRN